MMHLSALNCDIGKTNHLKVNVKLVDPSENYWENVLYNVYAYW